MNFSAIELATVVPLFFLCVGTLIRNWGTGPISIWSPMSLISLLYLYYTVIGPLYFVFSGSTTFLGIDYRAQFWRGWLASLVSLLLVWAGYLSYRGKKVQIGRVCSDELLQKFAIVLFGFSFTAIIYSLASTNSLTSAFDPLVGSGDTIDTANLTGFDFKGFWVNLINLSIPAIVLSLLVWLQRRSIYALIILVFISVFSVCYFLYTGFRFRIAWLAIAMLAAYYLWKKQRPNLLLLSGGAVLFVAAMGLIAMTRSYYSGLNLQKSSGASFSDYIDRGFDEAGTFFSLCSVTEAIPSKIGFTHWDPVWITVTLPVPRALWPGKPTSRTLLAVGESFGAAGAENAGQSIPFFGEWYIAWGWPGLIGSSFVFGWLCKRLWVWFLQRRADSLVILCYTVTLGYLYFVFSRGYTPLMVMNFIFGLLPFFLFYGWLRRKAYLRALGAFVRQQESWERQAQLERSRTEREKRMRT